MVIKRVLGLWFRVGGRVLGFKIVRLKVEGFGVEGFGLKPAHDMETGCIYGRRYVMSQPGCSPSVCLTIL